MPFITTERSNAVHSVTNRPDTVEQLLAALKVITLNEKLFALLSNNDPKALEQALDAVTAHEGVIGQQKALEALRKSSDRYRPTEEEAADEISNFINIMGFDNKKFVAKMACEHRTLQQTFTGICLSWLGHLSTLNENQYDARNEFSVKVAKEIAAALGNAGIRLDRLPCI